MRRSVVIILICIAIIIMILPHIYNRTELQRVSSTEENITEQIESKVDSIACNSNCRNCDRLNAGLPCIYK